MNEGSFVGEEDMRALSNSAQKGCGACDMQEEPSSQAKTGKIVLLLLLLVPLLYADEQKQGAKKPFIVASADHILITRLDVERYLRIFKQQYFKLEGSYLQYERRRARSMFLDALRSLISETLLINYAKRKDWVETGRIKPSEYADEPELIYEKEEKFEKQEPFRLKEHEERLVQKRIEEQAKRFGTLQNYSEVLASAGLSLEYIKDRIRIDLLYRRLFREELDYDRDVSPSEIKEFYRAHIDEFSEPDRVLLREIVIRFRRAGRVSRRKAEEKARRVKEALSEGKDFGEVAKEYSDAATAEDGGLWDEPVRLTSLRENIRSAVEKLKEGEFTEEPLLEVDPSMPDAEFVFYKVEKRIRGKRLPIEKAEEQIRRRILAKRRQKALDEFFCRLASSAHISIYEEGLTLEDVFPNLRLDK